MLVPPANLSTPDCGPATEVIVPAEVTKKGRRFPGTLKLIVTAKSSGKPKKDRDAILLRCGACGACPRCDKNPEGGPDELDLSSLGTGSDLDIGWGGGSHDFPLAARSGMKLCLSRCDADTSPVCDATGPVGAGSFNGILFGPPLPLLAQGVPICVVNRYRGNITGKFNVQTGVIPPDNPLMVRLFSDVHLTLPDQVCPRCTGNAPPEYGGTGMCDSGRNRGQACTIHSVLTVGEAAGDPVYPLSEDCPPDPGQLAGTVELNLAFTTEMSTLTGRCPGQTQDDACHGSGCGARCSGSACVSTTPDGRCIDAKGGVGQACCNDSTDTPCFRDPILRTGMASPPAPAWPDPTYPKTTEAGVLVATFCVGATNTVGVDAAAGLPGPGAIVLPVRENLLRVP